MMLIFNSGWVIGFVVPYMINPDAGNMGAKIGFVFAGLGIPLCVAFYFLIPETKGVGFDDVSSFGALTFMALTILDGLPLCQQCQAETLQKGI